MFLLSVFELIGTVAFAGSGAIIAIQKRLDLFGVLTLSVITAVGGGIFRDIIIGHTPPSAFENPFYCLISIVTAIIIMLLYPGMLKLIYKSNSHNEENENSFVAPQVQQRIDFIRNRTATMKKLNTLFDAIGLGAFTAVGANIAINSEVSNLFLVICMGAITGIGGGVLRDVFVQDIPMVFKREIYAVASILGALTLWLCEICNLGSYSLYISAFVTFTFRMLSIKYNWNLPKATFDKYTSKIGR